MNGVADPAKVAPTWVRWRIVMLLMALSYVSWFLRVGISVAYDERIKYVFPIDETTMGMVYSAFFFAYMLCMTPGGWLIDRWGARTALALMGFGLVLFGALTGLVGASPKLLAQLPAEVRIVGFSILTPLLLFLVIRSLMGVFAAPMYPAAANSVSQWIPFRRRGWANGLIQGSASLGIASVPLVVSTLIIWFDWPQTFLILAVGTGLLTILWALYATDHPEQHHGVNSAERDLIAADRPPTTPTALRGNWLQLLRNRSLVCLTLCYAAVGYFEYLFFFWMNHYFKEELKLPLEVRQTYDAIPLVAMAVGMMCGGWISDRLVRAYGYRFGRAIVPVTGMLLGAGFLVLGITFTNPEAVVACFAVALGGVGSAESPIWTSAVELGGRRGGTAGGICNTGSNAGGLISPTLTPYVAKHFGWQAGIALGSAVCFVGVVLWMWIDPRERIAED